MQAVIGAFAVAVACRILGIAAANAVVVRPATAPLLYAVPIGASLIGAGVIQWHLYPRRPSRLKLAAGALAGRAGASLMVLWPRRAAAAGAARMRG
jgi:hypothetical protein